MVFCAVFSFVCRLMDVESCASRGGGCGSKVVVVARVTAGKWKPSPGNGLFRLIFACSLVWFVDRLVRVRVILSASGERPTHAIGCQMFVFVVDQK